MSLRDKLKNITKQDTDTSIMEVLSVDKVNGTCVCNDGELDHTDVRLSAIIDDKKQKLYIIPKVGSTVLITPIEQSYDLQFVSMASEVEEFYLCVDDVIFDVDKDGFLFKKENETLSKLMEDLIAAIKAMKFTTNAGPTIKLINTPQFEAIETRFKKLLKAN